MGSSGAGCQPRELCTTVSGYAHGNQQLGALLTTPDNYSSTVYIPFIPWPQEGRLKDTLQIGRAHV